MKIFIIVVSLVLFGIALSRWFAPRVENYAGTTPVFNVREFFNGELHATGMLLDWRGRIKRRFTATMQGSWQGTHGTLKEEFRFYDGEVQQRTWALEMRSENRLSGHAVDIVGTAEGTMFGSVVKMDYIMRIPVSGRTYDIHMDDWLYMQPDGTVINEIRMGMFGLPVGRMLTTIRKL